VSEGLETAVSEPREGEQGAVLMDPREGGEVLLLDRTKAADHVVWKESGVDARLGDTILKG